MVARLSTILSVLQEFFLVVGNAFKGVFVSMISKCLPSGNVKIAIENGPFIVELPIKDGDSYVCLPEGMV